MSKNLIGTIKVQQSPEIKETSETSSLDFTVWLDGSNEYLEWEHIMGAIAGEMLYFNRHALCGVDLSDRVSMSVEWLTNCFDKLRLVKLEGMSALEFCFEFTSFTRGTLDERRVKSAISHHEAHEFFWDKLASSEITVWDKKSKSPVCVSLGFCSLEYVE